MCERMHAREGARGCDYVKNILFMSRIVGRTFYQRWARSFTGGSSFISKIYDINRERAEGQKAGEKERKSERGRERELEERVNGETRQHDKKIRTRV